ncbi:MAG: hypothetical protein R2729_26520 [Bryobacteraceae bacterium]
MDQALVSGSNFILAIVLGRWLPASDYGAYAVAFSLFLLIATVYQGVLLVPTLVLGSTTYKDRQSEYLGALIRLHIAITGSVALVLGAVVVGCEVLDVYLDFALCLAGVALAVPAVLLYWLARAAWYLTLRPGPAAAGAALYCGLLVTIIGGLHHTGHLTSLTGFIAMGAAGLIVGAILLARLKPDFSGGSLSTREVWERSWEYGRWELGVSLALWFPSNFCYPATAGVLGAAETATLRAIQNLALPINHTMTAVLRLAQPFISTRFAERGKAAVRPVYILAAVSSCATLAYLAVAAVFGKSLIGLFYGGKFLDGAGLLPWMLLTAVLAAATESIAVGLRAMRLSRAIFWAYLAAGVVVVALTVVAARAFGLFGVALTLAAAGIVSLAMVLLQFERVRRDSDDDWEKQFAAWEEAV